MVYFNYSIKSWFGKIGQSSSWRNLFERLSSSSDSLCSTKSTIKSKSRFFSSV